MTDLRTAVFDLRARLADPDRTFASVYAVDIVRDLTALLAAHPEPTKPAEDAAFEAAELALADDCDAAGLGRCKCPSDRQVRITADAVLALLPGRTEAEVKAEALYDLAAHMETLPAGTRTLHDPATIRAHADRNHPRKDTP